MHTYIEYHIILPYHIITYHIRGNPTCPKNGIPHQPLSLGVPLVVGIVLFKQTCCADPVSTQAIVHIHPPVIIISGLVCNLADTLGLGMFPSCHFIWSLLLAIRHAVLKHSSDMHHHSRLLSKIAVSPRARGVGDGGGLGWKGETAETVPCSEKRRHAWRKGSWRAEGGP